jgi:N-acetylglucosaminyl-diphospho-decaprenol L-rhamnosyltransferase
MRVAVVTIVQGRHQHLAAQHRSLAAGSLLPDHYVVVAMDDHALHDWSPQGDPVPDVVPLEGTPLGLPLAKARNEGVQRALRHGATDLILLDVDCLAGPELVHGYVSALATYPETVWSGPVTYLPPAKSTLGYDLACLESLDRPHPARPAPKPGELRTGADSALFWSLSFAVRAATWQRVGGFCESYIGYGGEDTDFGRLTQQRGVGLGWTGTARAYHQYHPSENPPVQHLDAILRNARLFHDRWGTWPMLGWLRAFERRGLVAFGTDGWKRRT